MVAKPKEVLLLIIEISGYTERIIGSRTALNHARFIISELMKTVMKSAGAPFELSYRVGDAALFYALKEGNPIPWLTAIPAVKKMLPSMFETFRQKALELQHSATCICGACSKADRLRLKIMVHTGEALFYKKGGSYELSGNDVTAIEWLLRNSPKSGEFILFSQKAYEELEGADSGMAAVDGVTNCDEAGEIKTMTHYPYGVQPETQETMPLPIEEEEKKKYSRAGYRLKRAASMALAAAGGFFWRKKTGYRNLPVT